MKQNENKVSRYINKAILLLLKYLRGSKSQELQSLIGISQPFTKHYQDREIWKNVGACGTHASDQKGLQNVGRKR
jgi:hypothetical protein